MEDDGDDETGMIGERAPTTAVAWPLVKEDTCVAALGVPGVFTVLGVPGVVVDVADDDGTILRRKSASRSSFPLLGPTLERAAFGAEDDADCSVGEELDSEEGEGGWIDCAVSPSATVSDC